MCYFHIHALRHVRAYIPDKMVNTVACSIVSWHLDYCNALFAGMSGVNLDRLQKVQNTLAHVIARQRKFDHITPILEVLHWLPVRSRATFKMIILVFTVQLTGQPSY